MVGRLNRIVYILPTGRYFLNRLQRLLQRCQDFGDQTISEAEDKDLKLWKLLLLNVTEEGVSINDITCTTPTLSSGLMHVNTALVDMTAMGCAGDGTYQLNYWGFSPSTYWSF